MTSAVLVVVLVLELILCAFLAVYTFVRCKSQKRLYFIIFTVLLFFYSLGYLQEVTSVSLDGAFTGLKTEYLGAAFLSQFFLFFIMDLCDMKLSRRFIFPMLIVPCITVALVWSSGYHQYYYAGMAFTSKGGINQTAISPGPWYYVHYSVAMMCLLASCAIIIRYYIKLRRDMRQQAPLLLLAPILQVAPQFMYAGGIRLGGVFYPILCLAVTAVMLFIYLMRYNIFDVYSQTAELALDFMADAFLLFDKDERFLEANQTAEKMFPWLKNVQKGLPMNNIPEWPAGLSSLSSFMEKDGIVDFEQNRDTPRCYQADINRIIAEGSQLSGWVLLIRDVTAEKALMEQMEAFAFTDRLTGLMTRDRFIELAGSEFEKVLSDKGELSVITIGMDNFKKVNDAYGSNIGDELIRLVSKSVLGLLGSEKLLARGSGIQFLLLTNTGNEKTAELASRIKNEIAYKAFEVNGNIIKCTASVGVAAKTACSNTLEKVMSNSDEALRRAQTNGYNRMEVY